MPRSPELPPRVFAKGRWYYLVSAEGKKRVWTKLTLQRDGVPALYRKLADLAARDIAPDRMPAMITDWLDEVGSKHAKKTQANDKWVMNALSAGFAEFRASQLTPPDCTTFLKPYRAKPRTHNEMRAGLRELMRFAEERGYRPAGSNPVDSIKTLPTPARDRYPTDSELRRIKVAAFYGADGKRTRQGATIAALIDLAYLTGQRIGDLLDLRWTKKAALNEKGLVEAAYIADEGIYFKPGKTATSTGAKVLIEWTPRLRDTVARIEKIGRRNLRWVITSQEAQRYDYEAFKSAWARAIARSGVKGLHFHDLRAKAVTDKEESHGMQQARRMATHSTEGQTASYVRHRKAQKTSATK
ncbi:MAG: integrase [Ramlibacter sp.]|jgi:integrase|nr:integrase [Ramlibacter sp.]